MISKNLSAFPEKSHRSRGISVHFTCFPEGWKVCVCVCLFVRVCVCGTLPGGLATGFFFFNFVASKSIWEAPAMAEMDSGHEGSVHLLCAPPDPVRQMSDELVS